MTKQLKYYKTFSFNDKYSTFYKARRLKPVLLILSVLFFSFSLYFFYQFINTKTINYIYSDKIKLLKNDLKKIEYKNQIAKKQNFLQYYNPLNIKLLYEVLDILKKFNLDKITEYKFNFNNKSVEVFIKTTSLNNVKIANYLKNKNIKKIELNSNKNNTKFEIYFIYKNNLKRYIR